MTNPQEVISLDPSKLWYKKQEDKIIVYKKTSISEKDNLIKAKNFLNKKLIKIGTVDYSVQVPNIYSWDENQNILSMSHCPGNNLELLLRNPEQRSFAIPFLQAIMRFVLTEHFYWQDFAPRNIILDNKIIYLVDFEKGLNFSIDNLVTFFRNHVFEEYSSFLLPSECLISTKHIFSPSLEEKNKKISINDIQVKRIKSIAIALGYSNSISIEDYLNIQKMIIKAEEPFYNDANLIFPRIELVKMLENKNTDPSVYQKYAKEILIRNNIFLQKNTNERTERD